MLVWRQQSIMHSIHIKITELWFIQSAIDLSFITFDRINLKNSTKSKFFHYSRSLKVKVTNKSNWFWFRNRFFIMSYKNETSRIQSWNFYYFWHRTVWLWIDNSFSYQMLLVINVRNHNGGHSQIEKQAALGQFSVWMFMNKNSMIIYLFTGK